MQTAHLTLLNLAENAEPQQIVLWQEFMEEQLYGFNLAWRVISRLRYGWRHRFSFSNLLLTFEDGWGNHTNPVPAEPGTTIRLAPAGKQKCIRTLSTGIIGKISVHNDLQDRVMRANLWRDGRQLAVSRYLAPGGTTSFRNAGERIRMGVVPGIEEGAMLSGEVMARCPTELNLCGITRSSIVMLGAGYGPAALPFSFHLIHPIATCCRGSQ